MRYSALMDISQMLAELRVELGQVDEAIAVLERMAAGSGRRRGRPPLWMAATEGKKRRGRPPGSKNRPKVTDEKKAPVGFTV
jgi:ATP/maltotriose-dependent transcriptional regulator MalT